ncbi:MAG: signal peptidase II [Oscillospiraceae bacterium]
MLYAITAVIILIFDQIVKYAITTSDIVLNGTPQAFIPGLINLTNIHNKGAAFGMLEDARWFFIILTLIVTIGIIFLLARNLITGKFGRWMLILVLAGGLGNCIDRAINGYVVDMFQFAFFPSFPIFNVADIFITLGGIAFCVWLIFHKEPEAPTPKKALDGTQRKATGRPAKGPDYITQMKKPGAPSSAPAQRAPQGTAARQTQGTASRKATAQRPTASRPAQEAASQKSLGFADWNMPGFDDISAPIGSPRPTQEPTEKRPAPAQSATEKRTAPSATSAKRSAQSSIPVQHSETAPAQAAKNGGEEFSLEDILAEFSKK